MKSLNTLLLITLVSLLFSSISAKPKPKKQDAEVHDLSPACGEINPCHLPEFCNDGDILADPFDCNSYLECNLGYQWVSLPCYPFMFDNDNCSCSGSNSDKCHPGCFVTATLPPGTTLADDVCPGEELPCVEGDRYPNQADCVTYFLCLYGGFVLQYCPTGTVFEIDPAVRECIDPYQGFDCENRCGVSGLLKAQPTDPLPPVKDEPVEREVEQPLKDAEPRANCEADPCGLPEYCYHGDVTADAYDCSHYYLCNYQVWQDMPCPPGTLFDWQTCSCDGNDDSLCFDEVCGPTTPAGPLPPGPCLGVPSPCEEAALYPDRLECDLYHECSGGVLVGKQCDVTFFPDTCIAGLDCLFDKVAETCVSPIDDPTFDCSDRCEYYPFPPNNEDSEAAASNVASREESASSCKSNKTPCEDGRLYRDAHDCSYYHTCANGAFNTKMRCSADDSACRAGKRCVFDQAAQQCVETHDHFKCEDTCP